MDGATDLFSQTSYVTLTIIKLGVVWDQAGKTWCSPPDYNANIDLLKGRSLNLG